MEFGLDSAISLKKGCYRGQEIVARVRNRGHLDRGFVGLILNCPVPPPRKAEIRSHGEKAGEVKSAIVSPRLESPLALAVIKTDLMKPGTTVEISCGDKTCTGTVVSFPLSQ